MISTVAGYRMYAANLTKSLETVSKQPMVERDSAYYLENITEIKSIDDFLGNDRVYRYAMKAYGLEDMTYAKAFMRKVLTEGVDSRDSFANSLSDKRYKEFAEAFNFARYGETTTVFTRTQQGTVDRYIRQTLEENAGDQNEGVRLALYFQRKASSITDAYQILADPALAKVARTMLGMPDEMALMDVDRQASILEKRLNIEDFQDPEKLDKLITRFTAMYEIANPSTTVSSSLAALFSQPIVSGLNSSVLASLQNLKMGGY